MFTLNNIVKTDDHSAYSVTSKACPKCDETVTIQISPEKLYAYNQGAYAQDVLSDFDDDTRERFVTGTCDDCWNGMFKDESYIDDYAEGSLFGWEN